MINPQTGTRTRTTAPSTQYPWLTGDDAANFIDYNEMAPGAMSQLQLNWHNPDYHRSNSSIATAYGMDWYNRNIAPTTAPISMAQDATWEDYAFQVIRRDYGNQLYDTSSNRWRRQSDWFGFVQPDRYVRNESLIHLGDFMGMDSWGDQFQTTDDIIDYAYGEGARQDVHHGTVDTNEAQYLVPHARGVYNYERNEYEHLQSQFERERERFAELVPDDYNIEGFNNASNALLRTWTTNLNALYQRTDNEASRIAMTQELNNLREINNAIQDHGVSSQEITQLVNQMSEAPLPIRVNYTPPERADLPVPTVHLMNIERKLTTRAGDQIADLYQGMRDAVETGVRGSTEARREFFEQFLRDIREGNADEIPYWAQEEAMTQIDELLESRGNYPDDIGDEQKYEEYQDIVDEPSEVQVVDQELRQFQEDFVAYSRNTMRRDYYRVLQENPDITFEDAFREVNDYPASYDPFQRPNRFEEVWRNSFQEAEDAVASGTNLDTAVYDQPLPLGQEWDINTPIQNSEEYMWGDLIEVGRDTTLPMADEVDVPDADGDLFDLFENQEAMDYGPGFNAEYSPETEAVYEQVAQELVDIGTVSFEEVTAMTANEIMALAGNAVSSGLFAIPQLVEFAPVLDRTWHHLFPTDEERIANEAAYTNQQNLLQEQDGLTQMNGQQAYVAIGGFWYRATVQNAVQLNQYGYNEFNVATVTLDDIAASGENQKYASGPRQQITVPIERGAFVLNTGPDGWTPDLIAHWQPYADTTVESYTTGERAIDHTGEQILYDGKWRTLQTVRMYGPNPVTGETNDQAVLVWEDGTTSTVARHISLKSRYWGEGGDQPDTTLEREPQNVVQRTGTERVPTRPTDTTTEHVPQNVVQHTGTQTPLPTAQRADPDTQGVMSYLLREHNEVYTIWRNPEYTGTDENRVERIFGGVVPFLSYNSDGHPILTDDKEIDHHGHTEFNMVHRASLELQEQATGTVSLENDANIQQTSPDETPTPTTQGETPNP